MNETTVQESLFEDPIGLRFRHGRERRRWSQEEVAQTLRIPIALIDAMEREDWARIGAPVYLRSHVGSYAQLLGLPAPVYRHHGLLRDEDGRKLSKSAQATSLEALREQGLSPQNIREMVGLP